MKKILMFMALSSLVCFFNISYASNSERAKANSDKLSGSVESTAGSILGNDKMKSEGQTKKLKGDLRNTKEDVKDKLSSN